MRAYDEKYLFDAMRGLGEAFEYADTLPELGMQGFSDLFIACGIADAFGSGSPVYVGAMSGIEIVLEVEARAGFYNLSELPSDGSHFEKGRAYWCGWMLAFYQWSSGQPFGHLANSLCMSDLEQLYPTMHETSEEKCAEALDAIILRRREKTALKSIRKARGISQGELAARSGVSLRAIQQYEQRAKDINKAQAFSLFSMARVLGCRMEALLEFGPR